MKNLICINVWCDWDLLKMYVSKSARDVMWVIDYFEMEEETMNLLGELPGPLDLAEVDNFLADDKTLFKKLGIAGKSKADTERSKSCTK